MIYFFQHSYLRDRHLDIIRNWPKEQVYNPDIVDSIIGSQVSKKYASQKKMNVSWRNRIPLINIKLRPNKAPMDAVIYLWGGVTLTGKFIVDLDNPWSLTAYNLRSMKLYAWVLRRILLSKRCVEIRCLSQACKLSLKEIFGDDVYHKAKVFYPKINQKVKYIIEKNNEECRFLFVGTQFEIKGGVELLKAFKCVYDNNKLARLDVVTHLPSKYQELVDACPGIHYHPAVFTRNQIHENFMSCADVFVLPTYVESFGMVALEAISHGLAVIATDVYALGELVIDRVNGRLISPPISIWDGVMPSQYYYDLVNIKSHIYNVDMLLFEDELFEAMLEMSLDPVWRMAARNASIKLMTENFAC